MDKKQIGIIGMGMAGVSESIHRASRHELDEVVLVGDRLEKRKPIFDMPVKKRLSNYRSQPRSMTPEEQEYYSVHKKLDGFHNPLTPQL